MVVNWEAVGAIGETVGALAVVITLVYLATQIRSQNRESRLAAVHELTEAFRAATMSFQDPNLASVFVRAKTDFTELPEEERLQFISMVHGVLRVWEDAYYQYGQNRLDERLWNAMVIQFSGYFSLPGVRRVWEIRKQAYSEDFRRFVDSTPPREYVTK